MKKALLSIASAALLAGNAMAAMPQVDASKLRATTGTGANKYVLVLSFNNNQRLDNMVIGVASDDASLTATKALQILAQNDVRVKYAGNDNAVESLYFDLDGNGEFDIRDTGFDGGWAAGEESTASDGTRVLSICHNGGDLDNPAYLFYLPEAGEEGVWMPEEMTVAMSDDFVLPVLVQPQGKTVGSVTNWQISKSATAYSYDSNAVISTPFKQVDGSYHARPTFKGTVGTSYVRYRPQWGTGYGYYDMLPFMKLNVVAPEVPVTAINVVSEITSPLNKVVDVAYTVEPANATFTSINMVVDDRTIASFSTTAGLKTSTKEGSTTVTISPLNDASVKSTFTLNAKLAKPVTNVHFGHGTENGVINVPVRQLIGLKPVVEPADADIPDVTITLSDNGSSRDDMTCSMYKVNWWDIDNVRSQFNELSGHRPTGDHPAKVTVTSNDGAFTREFVVNVVEADRNPLPGGYVNGTFILNEEWFGHTNGGLNYITDKDEFIYQAYEKENPGMGYGATSQHGCIWNGMLIVASKQAADGGDPLPGGGRLVIADAKTLKRLGSLDVLSITNEQGRTLSGDGRAVCGATPDKVYVSTNNGIFVVDIKDPSAPEIIGRIGMGEGADNADLYNGQVGDMVNARGHVYAVMQGGGLMIIDVDTDTLNPATVSDGNVQGVTQTGDGTVWYCTAKDGCSVFVAIDPDTLEEIDRVTMPASIGTVACGWGAWRSTAFKGSYADNNLWFVTGAAGIMGGATGDYYCYHVGDDPASIQPFFTLKDKTGINDFGEEVGLMTYGTPLYDPRHNHLIVMAGRSGAASGGYRDHWTMYVDGSTGEITKTFKLPAYYWFQSLPILPDKYAPAIDLAPIALDLNGGSQMIDLADYISDKDNIFNNILVDVTVPEPETEDGDASEEEEVAALAEEDSEEAGEEEDPDADKVFTVELNGYELTFNPKNVGDSFINVTLESNGTVVTTAIPVEIYDSSTTGIADTELAAVSSITSCGRDIVFSGMEGVNATVYDVNGRVMTSFTVDSDLFTARLGYSAGVYVVRADNGAALKVVLK